MLESLKPAAVGALAGALVVVAVVIHLDRNKSPQEAPQAPGKSAVVVHTQKVIQEASEATQRASRAKHQVVVRETFHESGGLASRTRVTTREKERSAQRVRVRRDLAATTDLSASQAVDAVATPKPLGLGAGLLASPTGAGLALTAEVLSVGPVQAKAGVGVINPQHPQPVGVVGVGAEVGPRMTLGVVGVVGIDQQGPWAAPGITLQHRF